MGSLKNVMMIAVLAAVGYGVYVALSRNNMDSGGQSSFEAAPLAQRKAETTGLKSPLPLGTGGTANPTAASGLAMPPGAPAMPLAPPLVQSPASGDRSGPPPGSLSGPSNGPTAAPPASSGGSGATLCPPVPPEGAAGAASANGTPARPAPPDGPPRDPTPAPSGGAPGSAPRNAGDAETRTAFADLMSEAKKKCEAGKLAETHLALSRLYLDPNLDQNLSAEQTKELIDLLDELAGTVIYSRQIYLERGYIVQQGDTIDKVARNYEVPWQLLAKINGLMQPDAPNTQETIKDRPLKPGMELKVLRGPFDAVVHLDRRELTLVLKNRYAGRFKIGVGRDQPKLEGDYTVCLMAPDPPYYGPDGLVVGPGDPKNPLGAAWIGLTAHIGIHGTNDPRGIGRDDNRGYICVGARDLQDLYGILTVGSRVTVVR